MVGGRLCYKINIDVLSITRDFEICKETVKCNLDTPPPPSHKQILQPTYVATAFSSAMHVACTFHTAIHFFTDFLSHFLLVSPVGKDGLHAVFGYGTCFSLVVGADVGL